jgi:hypothetical protein
MDHVGKTHACYEITHTDHRRYKLCLTIQYDITHTDHGKARDMCLAVYGVTQSCGSWKARDVLQYDISQS